MKRKKRGTGLPRLTILAMSRRDLQTFSEAVACLRGLVDDLAIIDRKLGTLAAFVLGPQPEPVQPEPVQPEPVQPEPVQPRARKRKGG